MTIIFLFITFFFTNEPLNIREFFIVFYIGAVISFIFFLAGFSILKKSHLGAIHWLLPMPLFILTLYKLMDNYILRKFNRHLIFYYKGGSRPGQSGREVFFQSALALACVLTLVIVGNHS
jgi:hypothetical protein